MTDCLQFTDENWRLRIIVLRRIGEKIKAQN
jgi:hypothetical protein